MPRPSFASDASSLKRFLGSTSHSATLLRNTAGNFGVRTLSNGLLFGAQILYANWLGIHAFGIYVLTLAWVNVLLLVGRQGFDIATVRFVASYFAGRSWNLLVGFIRASTLIVAAGSVAASAALVSTCWIIRDRIGEEILSAMLVGAAMIPVFALLQVKAATVRGLGHVVAADVPHSIVHPVLLILLPIACIPAFGVSSTAENALLAYLISITVSLAAVWAFMRRRLPPEISGVRPAYRLREWMLTAPAMILIAGFGVILNQIGVILVGILSGPADAGLFGAASRVASTLQLIVFSLTSAVAPMAARLHASGDGLGLQRAVSSTGRIVFLLSFAGAAFLMAVGEWVLGWFSPEFQAGYAAMAVLLVGQLAWAANAPAGVILNMTGHHNASAVILGIGIVVDVVLSVALIPFWGATGAAAANAATLVFWNLATAVGAYRWLGMRTWVRFTRSDPVSA